MACCHQVYKQIRLGPIQGDPYLIFQVGYGVVHPSFLSLVTGSDSLGWCVNGSPMKPKNMKLLSLFFLDVMHNDGTCIANLFSNCLGTWLSHCEGIFTRIPACIGMQKECCAGRAQQPDRGYISEHQLYFLILTNYNFP